MNLTRRWQRILATREPALVILATVSPYGADPMSTPHLALQPGSVRVATEVANVSADGMTLPFAPWLAEWPTLSEVYAPQDRRIEIQETQIKILGGAGLADVLLQAGGGQRATCRIDLWSPGLPLEDAIPRVVGPVRGVPRLPSRGEGVELTVTDGDPDRVVEYPAGPITRAEFRDAPAHVVGQRQRQNVFGGYLQVPCHQIDAEGLVFYVHDGEAHTGPSTVYNYGLEVTQSFVTETRRTDATGTPYTALVFSAQPTTPTGLVPSLSCSGGIGTVESSLIETLLVRVGGYKMTPRAVAAVRESAFPLALLANVRGDIRDFVARQLIPQTDLVMAFRHGMIDLLPLGGSTGEQRLGLGTGLLYRHASQESESTEIINAFSILCGRSGTGGSLVTVRRDVDSGSAAIRDRLARSQATWGRHHVEWNAQDLAVTEGADGVLTCPAGELLGDVLAKQHSAPWRPHKYRAGWLDGLSVDVGDHALVTDPNESLADAPCVVSRRDIHPTGIDLTFASQADPARATPFVRSIFSGS